jgi:hypothetical protein
MPNTVDTKKAPPADTTRDASDAGGSDSAVSDLTGLPGTTPEVDDLANKSQASMQAMLDAQLAMQTMGQLAQLKTAGMNIAGQAIGATTSMAVQVVTDLVKTSKDSVKAQGDAFQKPN